MKLVIRGLVGLAGVLALLLALQFWLNPALPAGRLGISPIGALGLATIRADMAGFFGAAGAFALFAAIRAEGKWLTAPLLMIAIALTGRVITVAVQGWSPELGLPMIVEAVLLALFAAGRRLMGSR
ncbi:hypothetical protein QO010_002070 [Caulobacter ginsengisoli]|uniref:DUF4345 domain-containing protein n=1 Tax=Caulobacter ginsengisoli TaxID=400775 RepID=A0ABU0IQJ5_9CAUL|nr:hypothetical protein [Caulobacter ginsengisoli]MDQ0464289.1 hypothetical protein [Caulobacter ginsengisoli]